MNHLWRYGPDWLKTGLPSSDNHRSEVVDRMPEECYKLKASHKKVHILIATEVNSIGDLIDCSQFSSLQKLVRVTASTFRAIERFKKVRNWEDGTLTTEEVLNAELRWIVDNQRKLKEQESFPSLKRQLNLFLDPQGLWRCRGRLENADLSYSSKYPILLSRDHPITSLTIEDAHRRVFHDGVRETIVTCIVTCFDSDMHRQEIL